MAIVSGKHLLDKAGEFQYGYPAFNISNVEQIHAVFDAALEVGSAVMIQYSSGARTYTKDPFVKYLIKAAAECYPSVPFAVHQDHGSSFDICKAAIDLGFSSVMIDGSLKEDGKTPADFEYNVNITKKVVDFAHKVGNIGVEGELGVLGSLVDGKGEKEDGHGAEGVLTRDMLLTDPKEAATFVKETNVDYLAVAIGTSHGAYKFSKKPDQEVLDINRIQEIYKATGGNVHIVMHGASSVPEDIRNTINMYGGNIPETYGTPIEEIQKAIKFGVRKVNIDTDLRMAFTGAVRKYMSTNVSQFDPRGYLKSAKAEMTKLCKERLIQFGCADSISHFKR